VVSGRHLTIARVAFDDVNYSFEQVCPPMLPIEGSGQHRVDSSQVSLTRRAAINALSGEILTVTHSHRGGGGLETRVASEMGSRQRLGGVDLSEIQ